MTDIESELRALLRGMAEEVGDPGEASPGVLRRARRMRRRTAGVVAAAAALLAAAGFAGVQAIAGLSPPAPGHPSPIQTTPAGPLPEAVRLDRIFDVQPDLFAAQGGDLYGVTVGS